MTSRILMHVGPSIGNYDVLSAAVQPNIGFASPEFNSAMKSSLEGLRYITGAADSYTPFILPGSGTVAMESVMSFIPRNSSILVVSNGVFGDRWEAIMSRYPVAIKVLKAEAGKSVSLEDIDHEVSSRRYFAVAMTQVETSTGVKLDVESVAKTVRNKVDLIIVDGVASIGGENMQAARWGIDVALTASQKALGAQAGAGLLVASRSAIEKLREESISGYFADLRNWSDLMNKFLAGGGGYFATPPIGTVFSIQKSMALIRSETIEARIKRHEICSQAFRAGISHMGLEILASEKLRSNTVTGVIVDGIDIPDFLQRCMKKGVEFGAGVHPAFRDRYFRVGHMGWVKPEHIITALNVIESSLEEIGKEVGHGSALAAEEVFSKHHEI